MTDDRPSAGAPQRRLQFDPARLLGFAPSPPMVGDGFTASNWTQLEADIVAVNAEPGKQTITLSANIAETGNLTAIDLQALTSLTIIGDGHTIDGGGLYRGLFVEAGTMAVQNLTINDAVAQGGAGGTDTVGGGGGGGGGAGLGGGVFVGAGASVVLDAVSFTADAAIGGAGGGGGAIPIFAGGAGGGGGGLAGAGGAGLINIGGSGGVPGVGVLAGGAGVGGIGGGDGPGGTGAFGGGGGGGGDGNGPTGGGSGGFGGGGGGSDFFSGAPSGSGGFGAGKGNSLATPKTGGGGGLGAGGDVFVQAGGALTIGAGSLGIATVGGGADGGSAGAAGAGYGSGLFLQGGPVTLAPATGQTLTIAGTVTDEYGSDAGQATGTAGALVIDGAGTVALDGLNDSYTGGTLLEQGTLVLGAPDAAGGYGPEPVAVNVGSEVGAPAVIPGGITFRSGGDPATLAFSTANAPTLNTLVGFSTGDVIDVTDLAGAAPVLFVGDGNILTVTGSDDHSVALQMDPSAPLGSTPFYAVADGNGGTDISLAPPPMPVTATLVSDTGASSTDGITNTDTLHGTATAGATVTLTEGNAILGSTTASDLGAWSFAPTLADGRHTIVATASGTGTGSASLGFVLDTARPVSTFGDIVTRGVNSGALAIDIPVPTETAGPGAALSVTIEELPRDGTVTLAGVAIGIGATMTAAQLGSLDFTPTPNQFNVPASALLYAVTDLAGNSSLGEAFLAIGPAVGLPVPADATPVAVAENADATPLGLLTPTDPDFASDLLTVAVNTLPDNGSLTLDGVALTANQSLTVADLAALDFTPTTGVSGQTSSFTYSVIDPAANTATGSVTVSVGPPAPSTPVLAAGSDSGAQGDGLTNDSTPTIDGTGIAGDTVTLYVEQGNAGPGAAILGSGTVDSEGNWSIVSSPLADGAYTVLAAQADGQGIRSTASGPLALTIDTVPPPALAVSQTFSDGLLASVGPQDVVTIFQGDRTIARLGADDNGDVAFLPSILAAGSYSLTATVTDAAGNVSQPSTPLAIVVAPDRSFAIDTDAGAPVVSRYSDTDVLQSQATTQLDNSVVTQSFSPADALVLTTITNPANLLAQSVSAEATTRNIYDSAGTLIGTVAEAGAADGIAAPGFLTAPVANGATTTTDAVANVIDLKSQNQTLALSGNDTVIAASGNDTISAGAWAVSVTGGSGLLTFYGGIGSSTVAGGAGTATIDGGDGGGSFTGGDGGSNVLAAGRGNTTLAGGGSHDLLFGGAGGSALFGSSGGHDTIVGGSGVGTIFAGTADLVFTGSGRSTVTGGTGGDDTVIGAGNGEIFGRGTDNALFAGTGYDTLHAGGGGDTLVGGTGRSVLVGGAGSTEFIAGGGASTVIGGTGSDTIWGGAGTLTASLGGGADTMVLGSGTTTVDGGGDADRYDIIAGEAGGRDVIAGFKTGIDSISLFGYAAAPTVSVAGGNTTLGLADGTMVTLLGVSQLAPGSVI